MSHLTERPAPGQRWVSDTEPELGLGIILKAHSGRVEIFFPAAAEHRQYALSSAPLRRVRFDVGDRIRTQEGKELVVDSAILEGDLIVYQSSGRKVTEAELADSISFSKPEDRLLSGQVDDLHTFDLRVRALHHRSEIRKSPVRGFVGGRVDMIPHQMFIAREVTSRLTPRVLLADEVGLGKTIEAGLILHRLHLTGRAERVLILVPEPLIHQWFVEMLRRFNLRFSIFDEERCESIEANDPEANPFLDSQLVLCSVEFLARDSTRALQAVEAFWDLVIVDEAHHLEWHPDQPSREYQLAEQLALHSPGLLLLTATPQQLGPEGHFARLRLLDPVRYASLDQFLKESENYTEVAKAIERLLAGKPFTKREKTVFADKSARIRRHLEAMGKGNGGSREELVAELVDEFGTGRVLFRNSRAAMTGFPERYANLVPLPAGDAKERKIEWLANLLRQLREEKVLLICRSRELAGEIYESLQEKISVKCALFHEELTLIQRDRNAAFFSEEDGARILICSEIGSEGRNFQFAHHLVLFDLPNDPERLEQRIGRLDRIGQTSAITIHVPFQKRTGSEVLARWYHEGLNAFEKSLHGATEIARVFSNQLADVRNEPSELRIKKLLLATRKSRESISARLSGGYDRLLELSSCKPAQATETIEAIRAADGDQAFEAFLTDLIDYFGVNIEESGSRSYVYQPGHLLTDAFPALPNEGFSGTFDRKRALSRDDVNFMSFDHPMVRGAIDLLLGSEAGNAAFGIWSTPGPEAILLEIYGVVECVAPASLHADRFLPATPVRVVVDHSLNNQTADGALAKAKLQKGNIYTLLDKVRVKRDLLPAMIQGAERIAAAEMQLLVDSALVMMRSKLQSEIDRLEDLSMLNDHVRPEEISGLKNQMAALEEAISGARLRLDALRMIWRKADRGRDVR